MTTPNGLRRVPWGDIDGKQAWLSGDPGGVLTQLADATEEHTIQLARAALVTARSLLADESLTATRLRATVERLANELERTLEVAEMRAERLGVDQD